ncbi:hypothetical protein ACVXHA_12265 [Escherichia coli]
MAKGFHRRKQFRGYPVTRNEPGTLMATSMPGPFLVVLSSRCAAGLRPLNHQNGFIPRHYGLPKRTVTRRFNCSRSAGWRWFYCRAGSSSNSST